MPSLHFTNQGAGARVKMIFPNYSSTRVIILSGVIFLLSCGGGGGGSSGGSFAFSPDRINFVAETPATPPQGSRLVTGSVSEGFSGVLYLLTDIQGDAVTGFNNFVINPGGLSASTLLNIPTPPDLGVGVHKSTLTIWACLNSPTCASGELDGSPQSVEVTYEVKSSVKADTMMPGTGIANQAGTVILRGSGFATDNITSVSFGGNAATGFTIVSDSEIHADYGALIVGNYDLSLENAAGAVAYDAELKMVDVAAYPAASLTYPVVVDHVLEMVFDVEREALLVAVELADRAQNKILRYQFAAGSFTSLATLDLPLLRDLTLSPDGSEIIAITDSSIKHLDPVTLSESASTLVNSTSDFYLKNLALSNDGNLYVVSEENDVFQTAASYLYVLSSRTLYSAGHRCDVKLRSIASADGSTIIVINDGVRGALQFCEFDASAGSFSELGAFDSKVCRDCPSALSSRGDRFAYAYDVSGTGIIVYQNNDTSVLNELGRISGYYSGIAFAQDGNILYAYDRTNSLLRAFDLTMPIPVDSFQEIGAGTALAGSTGDVVKMQVTPNDETVFIAGENSIAVQPVP